MSESAAAGPFYPEPDSPQPHERVTRLKMRLWEDHRSQYEIAAEIGIAPSRLSEYASAIRPIPPRRIMRLCEVLNCQPDDLIGWESIG